MIDPDGRDVITAVVTWGGYDPELDQYYTASNISIYQTFPLNPFVNMLRFMMNYGPLMNLSQGLLTYQRQVALETARTRALSLLDKPDCIGWLSGVFVRSEYIKNPETPTETNVHQAFSNLSYISVLLSKAVTFEQTGTTDRTILPNGNTRMTLAEVPTGTAHIKVYDDFFGPDLTPLQHAQTVIHEMSHIAGHYNDLTLAKATGYSGSDPGEASVYYGHVVESSPCR
jgi:hypothetical protein